MNTYSLSQEINITMLYKERIADKIIQASQPIIEALKMMDTQKVKLLYVYDKVDFISIITIGDIQRAIINNIKLKSPLSLILDHHKIYAQETDSLADIKKTMTRLRAESMPVLNEEGRLIDVYFWEDLFKENIIEKREKINLPVVIMAGGKGTRLKPLTNVIPKPLIPINEKTILEIIMDQFEAIGCCDFYMSVNYKYDLMQYYLHNLDHNYDIDFFKEEKPLGTIGSVSLLKNKITTPFFVSNCDIIIDQDFRDVYEYHKDNNNDITVVTALKNIKIPYGVIETSEEGLMKGITEKPDLTYMINSGVYILNPDVINEIPMNTFYHITHLIEKVRKRGGRVGCFPVSEKAWTDMGDWDEYLKLINK